MNGLKSSFLSGVRPFFGPEDDRRAAAQAEREKIKVENTKKNEPEKKEEKKDDVEAKSEEVSEEGKDDVEEIEEETEIVETEIKEEEKTIDQYKAELAAAQKKVARLEKRTGRTAGERDQYKKDLAAANASLTAKVAEGAEGFTEEEVERRAEAKAEAKATDREFQKAVQTLVKAATKVDPQFNAKAQELAQDVAPIPQFMIAALEDLDNGGAVLAHLANNPDEYEEIFNLTPARMTTRLSKLSIKLEEAVKPKKKEISKVPAPLDTIKGNEKSPNQLPANPTKNMAEFVEQRNRQVAERRKAKYG